MHAGYDTSWQLPFTTIGLDGVDLEAVPLVVPSVCVGRLRGRH